MKIETFNYMKIIFISCFFISNSVFARSPITPDTFINITTNKEFALVMIPRKGYNLTGIEQSGLYKTSDLKKPIWTLDWYETNLISNIDGKFLVRFGSWYSSPKQVGALSFYMNGKLIKSYYIDDLVKIPPRNNIRYPHTRGSWIKKREYMEGDGVLYLKTIENNRKQ